MKDKLFWLDYIRVISTIAVIVLHVAAPILNKYGEVNPKTWHTGNFIDSTVRFCVPVFFMLSGALLLSKDYILSHFFKKRFIRIIPPLIFWSLVYICYDHVLLGEKSYTLIGFIKMVVKNLLYTSKFHLWFVYTLLGLYLFVPILRKWIKNASNNDILYFLIIWFISIIYSLPYFKAYFPNIPLTNFSGYIGYMVLGYYLTNLRIRNKVIPILLLITGIGVTMYGTYYLTSKNNQFTVDFYRYLTPNVLLSSIGVFLIFKNVSIKNHRIKSLIVLLSNLSFGIYLVHILILALLSLIGIDWEFAHPIISIPVTSAICLLLSSLTIYLIRKIKFGKYISG